VTIPEESLDQGAYTLLTDVGESDQARMLLSAASVWDQGSLRRMCDLGMTAGWRCWEVGAGEGSTARGMAKLVGASGHVVATDIDTSLLDTSGHENIEVVQHDVVADDPPGGPFDLVHARCLLPHLPEREEAFERLASAVAPGGWLLLEDTDWATFLVAHPPMREFELLRAGLEAAMADGGFDNTCGMGNFHRLRAADFDDVRGEAEASVMRAGSPGVTWYHHWAGRLREQIVAAGHLTDAEFDRADARFDDPDAVWLSQTMISASGRRAAD
jgi:SAM-dependent methyltransferase